MQIQKEVLNELKCCFFNDGHIAIEPIQVSCGAIGCKECICSSKEELIDCYSCKDKHVKRGLINKPKIKVVENVVISCLNDLFEYTRENLKNTFDLLKGKILDLNCM